MFSHLNMLGKRTTTVPMITVAHFNTFLGAQPKLAGMENIMQGRLGMDTIMSEYVKIGKHVHCHTNVSWFVIEIHF